MWGIGNVDRLHRALRENPTQVWHFIFDPTSLPRNQGLYRKHQRELEASVECFADELSRDTFRDYCYAMETGDGTRDLAHLCPHTYFNELTQGLRKRNGAYVDGGAFDGDSLAAYLSFAGERGQKVFAFEPDAVNYALLTKHFSARLHTKLLQKGVGDSEHWVSIVEPQGQSTRLLDDEAGNIEITTIDAVVGEAKVACIKLDVEGSELAALQGTSRVIRRDKPYLLISAYHRPEDLVTLPRYFIDLGLDRDYQLYLRHHAPTRCELVLYGIPRV